jgi:hypothetical protein
VLRQFMRGYVEQVRTTAPKLNTNSKVKKELN